MAACEASVVEHGAGTARQRLRTVLAGAGTATGVNGHLENRSGRNAACGALRCAGGLRPNLSASAKRRIAKPWRENLIIQNLLVREEIVYGNGSMHRTRIFGGMRQNRNRGYASFM